MFFAQSLVIAITIYALIGVVFGIFFVFTRAHRIDPAAEKAGFFFKFLIFFGSAALWPVLVGRAFGKQHEPVEKNAHRRVAG